MVTDPVCKMDVDEKVASHSSVFESERYFFCSEGCQAEFLRHPRDYVKPDRPPSDRSPEEGRDV